MEWWDAVTDWFSGGSDEPQESYLDNDMDYFDFNEDTSPEYQTTSGFDTSLLDDSNTYWDYEAPEAPQEDDGNIFGASVEFFKDNPMLSKALLALGGNYFMSKRAEDLSEEEYKRQQELMKLKASLSSRGGGGGPPAAKTTTNKGPGALKRG